MKNLICLTLAAGCLSLAGVSAAVPASNANFLKPEEAIAQMSVPDGFEVKAFVAEPHIGEAIAFCFDHRGRLWTLENFNYQTRKAHSTDKKNRIQIFEDTDGDGVFNTKKLFTDQLTFSSGIAVGMGGVYVGTPPNLIFIPDADGDDKPDGEPEILLDGWGHNDRHETLNSFIWGPDGWLYGCHGVFTQSRVGAPGTPDDQRQFIDGGIWRFHPVKKSFEIFAEGLSNPWGFDFNDEGQGFATCCVIPHLFHIIQGGIYEKQSRANVNPFVYDNIKTIRDHAHKSAHGGARFYLADAFPEEYHDRLFMNNIHQHAVLTDIMVPNGSGYIGSHGDDFLPANDLAWVGFSTEIGPEGAVYVLDWHDQDICGNAIKFPNSGRVYRITPKGLKSPTGIDLGAKSDAELVKLQSHVNDWFVRHARVLLHHRTVTGKLDKKLVHAQLEALLKFAPNTGKRLRALWALHVTEGLSSDRLVALLKHEDAHVRAWSVQLLCEEGKPSDAALSAFARMAAEDSSPVVRLYLAAALQRLPFDQRWDILSALAQHEEDVDDHNIPRMLWIALEPMVPDHSAKALELATLSKMPKLQEFVPRRMLGETTKKPAKKKRNPKATPKWQTDIQKVAPGFEVKNSGELGVVYHKSYKNRIAVQTHPLKKGQPSYLRRSVDIPKGKKTVLHTTISHHPHGDFELRVKVDGKVLSKQEVSAGTMTDEWLHHEVDLTEYAGKKIELHLENFPTGWMNEWAYWHEVKIVSEPDAGEKAAEGAKADPGAKGEKAKVVFISGKRSHGRMAHEHRAGNMLLARRLEASGLNVEPIVLPESGYPKDPSVLDDAATIVIFCTGHKGHVLSKHLDEFDALMKRGTGVIMIHWATEAEKGKPGEKFLDWMGGFCDLDWSVNPHWEAQFREFPKHPICNGVQPFAVHDEWYYHMRFVEDKKGLTPILFDLPGPETLKRPDGARSGNPAVRKAVANGEKQTVAWAYEREGGGRGFGFTGGHNHLSWQSDGFRKIMLNAILWTARVEVPAEGVDSKRPFDIEMKQNLD